MSVSRRSFIHNALAAGSMFPLFSMNYSRDKVELKIKNKDEDYWRKVAGMYHQNINFNYTTYHYLILQSNNN